MHVRNFLSLSFSLCKLFERASRFTASTIVKQIVERNTRLEAHARIPFKTRVYRCLVERKGKVFVEETTWNSVEDCLRSDYLLTLCDWIFRVHRVKLWPIIIFLFW